MSPNVQEIAKRLKARRIQATALWAAWNLLPNLLPTLLLGMSLLFLTQAWEWMTFVRQGEFALYSIAAIVPTFYGFLHDSNPNAKNSSSHERLIVIWIGGL